MHGTHINKATVTQTVAMAVPAFRRSCPGEGGSKAMQIRKRAACLMLYAAVDGLMRVAPTTGEAGLGEQTVLVYAAQIESVKKQIVLSL